MKVEDAIQSGLDKSKRGREWSKGRLTKRMPNLTSVLSFFARECTERGYPSKVMLTVVQRAMVLGLIKWSLNNSTEPEWIYTFLRDVINKWPELVKKEIQTDKSGKRMYLHARPNIVDVLMCKQSILSYVYCDTDKVRATVAPIERTSIQTVTLTKKKSIEDAMEEEMGESYYDD